MSHSIAAIIIVEPKRVAPARAVIAEKNYALGSGLFEPFAKMNIKIDKMMPNSKIGERKGNISDTSPIITFPKKEPALK